VQNSATNQVDMQMEDGLARTWTDIDYGAISIFNAAAASDLRGH
jgi:hypothetical protein